MAINLTTINSPIGTMLAGATETGVCLLEFSERRGTKAVDEMKKITGFEALYEETSILIQLKKELEEYFEGTRRTFDVPLHYPGTEFQVQVWNALLQIEYGKTKSYKQQSELLNNPGAIRAVGTANGANRISILIPCHRVIGENGNLTGYGGGIWRKKWLLEHEQGKAFPKQMGLFEY
jgi:AraC family transcriptional regulator, regulatory protein of adaptative response / methylated-DNA-[protein]-cysteine methyltransferase